jgi:hypothetical protein
VANHFARPVSLVLRVPWFFIQPERSQSRRADW